ncbi:MAG: glycosyltransferase family 4 protein [Nitrososphaerales archaeon]
MSGSNNITLEDSVRSKFCYIVSSCPPDSDEHSAHVPRFLQELAKKVDLYVIVERGPAADISVGGPIKVFVQRRRRRCGRTLELISLTLHLWRLGCRKFFVRISVPATIVIASLGRMVGFETYYWSSGQGRNILPQGRCWQERWSRLDYFVRELHFRLALRLSDWVVTGPERMGDYYAQEFNVNPNKIVIIYNDIDLSSIGELDTRVSKKEARARLGLPDPCPILLFIGRVSPLKGGAYIVPVVQGVLSVFPDVLCLVVGAVHLPEVLQEVHKCGLENVVHFLGSKPNAELPGFFRAADLFLMPSNSEGFPRVLLESMAYGLPFVAFEVGGILDIVDEEQREWVVGRGDVKAMADRICRLLVDPSLRERLTMAGQERVRRFSTQAVAEMFMQRIVNR